jgi:hypothetical protein
MIDLEIPLVFYTALFFTLLYIWKQEPLFGVLTFGGWFSLGMMWLLIKPMETAYAFAFFFQGVGVLFLVAVIVQYISHTDMREGRSEEEEND